MTTSLPGAATQIRLVAIGDSFTEGVGDDDEVVTFPGWAGRLATRLARFAHRPVYYANLAVRGMLQSILDDQLDDALALRPLPTHMTICAGGNDMLRPSYDPLALLGSLDLAVQRVQAEGIRPVLLSPADPSNRLPFGALVRRRGGRWAQVLADYSARRHLAFVDVSHDRVLTDARFWAPDRLHLNSWGHQRVADLAAHALRAGPPVSAVLTGSSGRRRLNTETRYYREHVAPWVVRRLRGRSSGDGRAPSIPGWVPVPPGGVEASPPS